MFFRKLYVRTQLAYHDHLKLHTFLTSGNNKSAAVFSAGVAAASKAGVDFGNCVGTMFDHFNHVRAYWHYSFKCDVYSGLFSVGLPVTAVPAQFFIPSTSVIHSDSSVAYFPRGRGRYVNEHSRPHRHQR
jgi:hypothetical protein